MVPFSPIILSSTGSQLDNQKHLWPVHDVSTAFLMDRFYELWWSDANPSIAQALHDAAQWLRNATKTDLLRRIGDSTLSPQVKELLQQLLDRALVEETKRMSVGAESQVIDYLYSRPADRPFAHPHYWAAFAPFGAVLD